MGCWRVLVLAVSFLLCCIAGAAQAGSHIFVEDAGNGSILEYDATGAFIRTFVSAGSGGLTQPGGIIFGPDGNLYVASYGPPTSVLRYDGQTGAFLGAFVPGGSGGAIALDGIVFGPNGNLFAADFLAANVKEYDGTTGAFIKVFASSAVASSTASNGQVLGVYPSEVVFGPNGNLYLGEESDVEEFDGATGAFIQALPPGPGPAAIEPTPIAFGPDGSLYVGTSGPCCPEVSGEILRYNPTTGALIDVFVPPGSGGMEAVGHMVFRPDGYLYAGSVNTAGNLGAFQILRYNATTGAFVDVFISPGAGGLNGARNFTFGPATCPPPIITTLTANPDTLWPPDHKMIPVNVSATTSDGCGAVSCKITSVSSNEPVDADGDWVITGNLTLNLRAERNGLGTGRVYTITVQCTDGSGNSTTKTVTVTVPHDQGY